MSSLGVFALLAVVGGVAAPKAAKALYIKKLIPFGSLKAVFYLFSTLFVVGITLAAYLLVVALINNRIIAAVVATVVFIPGITRYLNQNIPHALTVIRGHID